MTRRSSGSAFAPGAFVFPGGVLERSDAGDAMRERCIGLDRQHLEAQLARATDSGAAVAGDDLAALSITALRELFEEAGILIAVDAAGECVPAAEVFADAVQAMREPIRRGALGFADFLRERDWFADARDVWLFSHWITPPTEPRRYDTRFFFAAAPADQAGSADACETHDGCWISPARALSRAAGGELHLVYPTIKHLQRLLPLTTLSQARRFASHKAIRTILPATTVAGGFVMPAALENAW
jgi:8-oxo-dGTP pyrophosphatase MutT (NUDIX family)